MLSLTMREGEKVIIHDDGREICTLQLVQSRYGSVRIAFSADETVGIDRQDLFKRKYPPTVENTSRK